MAPDHCTNHCGCADKPEPKSNLPWWLPLTLGIILALLSEVVSVLHFNQSKWLSLALAVAAVLIAGWRTYFSGWRSLFTLKLNMNALMTIAVTGAVILGSWPEAAMVMVLFTLAEEIEKISLAKAKRAVANLVEGSPLETTVQMPDGTWKTIPTAQVPVGAVLRVKPGERLSLDGVITAGNPCINQAAITGESIPVDKLIGDEVFAGTLNQTGEFQMLCTSIASESLLARIGSAIETALSKKAPSQRFIDQFAQIYTPTIFVIALLIAIFVPIILNEPWQPWIYRALVLLVIACPCALVISTPVSIVSGLTRAAKQGILIKGGQFLEQGWRLSVLGLDKTGTLTLGKPSVKNVYSLTGIEQENLSLATGLAEHSDHPLSRAITVYGQEKTIIPSVIENFTAKAGMGVSAQLGIVNYYLGNQRLIQDLGLETSDLTKIIRQIESTGQTPVILASTSAALLVFALADSIKNTSAQAVTNLHRLGVHLRVLSGDAQKVVQTIANQLDIKQAQGAMLPEDKLNAVEAMVKENPNRLVGMVGDGINDAPALARSNIGFAMGAIGSDTAIETADVAIMDDDLRKIPTFIELSHATHNILVQNIVFAIGIKLIFFVLTLYGLTNMWEAVFADTGVSLLVIANALRLLKK